VGWKRRFASGGQGGVLLLSENQCGMETRGFEYVVLWDLVEREPMWDGNVGLLLTCFKNVR